MAVGSLRGLILGVMASPLLVLVLGTGRSSDGTGAGILLAIPVLGAVLGFVLGLAIPLLQHPLSGPSNARSERAPYRTRALTLALIALVPPGLGLAMVVAGWLVCTRVADTGSAPQAADIIGYWAFVACLAGPLGASMAIWALLSAWWASPKHPEHAEPAPSRRRLIVRLALVALVLNLAAPWLLREGRLLPTEDRYLESRSDKPAAVPISRSPSSSGLNPTGAPASPRARPEDRRRLQGAAQGQPSPPARHPDP